MSSFKVEIGHIRTTIEYRGNYTVLLVPQICGFLKQCAESICENRKWDVKAISKESSDLRIIELNGILQTIVNNAEAKLSKTSTPASSPQGTVLMSSPRSSSSGSPHGSGRHFSFNNYRTVDDYNNNILNKYHDAFREVAHSLASMDNPDIRRLRGSSLRGGSM